MRPTRSGLCRSALDIRFERRIILSSSISFPGNHSASTGFHGDPEGYARAVREFLEGAALEDGLELGSPRPV
ncbi:hypothetical protein GCM10011609_64940 [Lentzea pudingi]|uniref:Uncharacterized protein n=1 Tax=Lentzea pudingi TaxID=1789439 RepID=A0ABQ2INK7_9PSEU|nr:hypothetical protein GCM10011609_64940 [Lentzea pudingi]